MSLRAFPVLGAAALLAIAMPASANTVPVPHAAFARHPDVLDVWVAGGFVGLTGAQDAQDAALAACRKAMGEGCEPVGSWQIGYLALVRTEQGQLAFGSGNTREAAIANTPKICNERTKMECDTVLVISAATRKHAPDLRRARLRFAAAAAPDSGPGHASLAIAAGRTSYAQAEADALASCQRLHAVQACKVMAWGANGVLQAFDYEGRRFGMVPETSVKRAKQAVEQLCLGEIGADCRLQAAYPTDRLKDYVHHYVNEGVR
ncbi:DUF4189 domain-containing protein [Altererythrobacter sp. BO-6]|uniref:DUF4189 domain-containing protein n=1 Tax=Altererythrobacter sp. BO-6 TaxID=2604537 RepID=UPI0013E109FB|nr:DUF4189 domain-containing protein [Altererythrobacter sp. BO-6]QIG54545.1 DUF4189 domain-containing protein [Altererythrobacter sp. BO-6]